MDHRLTTFLSCRVNSVHWYSIIPQHSGAANWSGASLCRNCVVGVNWNKDPIALVEYLQGMADSVKRRHVQ